MNAAKKIILLLWLVIVASVANVSALTPSATETRVGQKSFAPLESRQAEPSQTPGLHQENASCGYELAPESLLAAESGAARLPQFYIENGVRRSIASREAGLGEIPATIFREGQPPTTTTLRLDQLFSPKPEIPLDSRFLNIQPPIRAPIQVQPLGVPGQMPTVPLNQVRIVP